MCFAGLPAPGVKGVLLARLAVLGGWGGRTLLSPRMSGAAGSGVRADAWPWKKEPLMQNIGVVFHWS